MNAKTQAQLKEALDYDNDRREAAADVIETSLARQRAAWELHKNTVNAAIDGPIGRMGGRVPRHD